ncbi:MAG: S8 family peptidase [Acidobacteria bacterium]|nr:S8 family peptidase [Acidobacteriota bacterium]
MARNLDHLELPPWHEQFPRRKHGGGRQPERADHREHGRRLAEQAIQVANRLQQRPADYPQGINPKFVFKLQLHPQGNLNEEELQRLGLRMLARDARRVIVVFPDEATLNELRRRLSEYVDEERYKNLASIEAIQELSAEDRIGRRLRENPLAADETAALDIELWHPGTREECQEQIGEIRGYLEGHGLRVTDQWIGENLCLMRARVNQNVLYQLLEIDYVKEIDRRAAPAFEMLDVARAELADYRIEEAARDDLVGVLIIDSGVAGLHPMIRPALGDAQIFPDRLREKITGGGEDGDERSGGHGTAVAGIAIYGDVGASIASRTFRPLVNLFSARVTDSNNEYDEDELIEHQLEEAVEYFLEHYPSVKVINISLGDDRMVYSDGDYQFRLAAAIDEIAWKHRDREIVFVISAGNFFPDDMSDEEAKQKYPGYLRTDSARIISPATSAIALTIGGLSYGGGRALGQYQETDLNLLIAGERDYPSPFTRTGFGVDGAIKPDLVDYAGDLRFERGRVIGKRTGEAPQHAGLPTTAKHFAPPEGKLFRTVSGTSFATPRVSNLAARLFSEFPSASSNLIRALIVDSARVPLTRPGEFVGKETWDKDIMRVYGYGQPDFERARWSSENAVLLLADGVMPIDSFQIFTVPSLPPEFLTTRGKGYISVTLAFDPPTRHTRGDSYLGVSMEFALFRNVAPEKIAEALRAWNQQEIEGFESEEIPALKGISRQRIDLKPSRQLLKKGTLQRAIKRIAKANWQYDGGPLRLVVTCQRKWVPATMESQRYAVVMSVAHDDPSVDLHAHLLQQTRITQRVRVRA